MLDLNSFKLSLVRQNLNEEIFLIYFFDCGSLQEFNDTFIVFFT